MQFDVPYRVHWESLRRELARSVFDQPSRPADTAFFEAAGVVVHQMAVIEAGMENQRLAPPLLQSIVHQPFVLGYIFGAAASAIERHGVDRHSQEATSVFVTLTQIVLRGGTFDDCVALHKAGMADADYTEAMSQAGDDADRFAAGGGQPYRLFMWLAPRIGLRPPSANR